MNVVLSGKPAVQSNAKGSPEAYLKLKRRPDKQRYLSRAKVKLFNTYLRLVRTASRLAHTVHDRLISSLSSAHSKAFKPRLLDDVTRLRTTSLTLDYDHRAWRKVVAPWRMDYLFVSPDSVAFHSDIKNSFVYLHKIAASIALFPSSHPLLFFQQENTFLFEKLHEIPYHAPGAILQLTEFEWTTIIRPTYTLNIDIPATCTQYDFGAPAIYVGGSLNFGHFLTDYYPKLLAIDEAIRRDPALANELPRLVIVYCSPPEFDYLVRAHPDYNFVNFANHESSLIDVGELYTTQYIPFPVACHLLRKQLQTATPPVAKTPARRRGASGKKTKVFLSRRGFARRRIANEDELIKMLETQGFDIIHVKEYTVEALAAKLADYNVIVSGLGAHTVNAIFLPPGSTFLEIVPASFDKSKGWQYNHSLFMSAGIHYVRYVAQDSSASIEGEEAAVGIFDWESYVDLKALRQRVVEIGKAA